MSKLSNRLPDQRHIAVQACPQSRMLLGNELDAVAGGYACLPAVQAGCEPKRITDGTSNTILFA
jgi:hypothetical protein